MHTTGRGATDPAGTGAVYHTIWTLSLRARPAACQLKGATPQCPLGFCYAPTTGDGVSHTGVCSRHEHGGHCETCSATGADTAHTAGAGATRTADIGEGVLCHWWCCAPTAIAAPQTRSHDNHWRECRDPCMSCRDVPLSPQRRCCDHCTSRCDALKPPAQVLQSQKGLVRCTPPQEYGAGVTAGAGVMCSTTGADGAIIAGAGAMHSTTSSGGCLL